MNEMNKFEIGDRVRVEKLGKEGIVKDYYCDYVVGDHQVQVQLDGEKVSLSYGEDGVTYIGEDKYEYACVRYRKNGNIYPETIIWEDQRSAMNDVQFMSASSKHYDYRLMKRRKAGPVEEA